MKYSIIAICIVFLACSASQTESNQLPRDVTALRALQKSKKAEIKALNQELTKIETLIDSLDQDKVIQRKLVTVKPAARQDFERFVKVQGAVETDDIVSVSSETGGRIVRMSLNEGDYVRKGQLIAKIDMETIRKQMDELNTQLDLAKTTYERQQRLWDQQIGSEMQYLQAKNAVERIEKNLETLEHQLSKENVYAPISGAVDMVNLKSGETAGPGTPIIMILNTSRVKVVVDLPESFLSKVKRGEYVTVFFPALNQEIKARITLIGRKIDPANRTFEAEIDILNKDGLFKPNLLAEVMIQDYFATDVVVIPQELVQQEVSGQNYVLIQGEGEDGHFAQKREVVPGESSESDVIISEGLEGGEMLIIDGARSLSENELIDIVSAN